MAPMSASADELEPGWIAPPQGTVTYEDYSRMPDDGKRYEVLDGELVMNPAPTTKHQRVTLRLARWLADHVEEHALGEVFISPYDVVLGPRVVVQPDVLFVSTAKQGIVNEKNAAGPPDLVIEVISPANRRKDVIRKREIYQRFAVPEYWILDPEVDTATVLRLDPEGTYARVAEFSLIEGGGALTSPLLPELKVSIERLFG